MLEDSSPHTSDSTGSSAQEHRLSKPRQYFSLSQEMLWLSPRTGKMSLWGWAEFSLLSCKQL